MPGDPGQACGAPPGWSPQAIFASLGCGLFNALRITRGKPPPFIAVLSSQRTALALNLYTQARAIDAAVPLLNVFGPAVPVFGTPVSRGAILLILIAVCMLPLRGPLEVLAAVSA